VWLDEQFLRPYDYWQFWRNSQDADVGRFLRLFTDLPLNEVERLESLPGAEINEAKIVLATEATAMLHGREEAQKSADTARGVFAAVGTASGSGSVAAVSLPTLSIGDGINIAHALTALGFTSSNKEAKRKVVEGAVRLDEVVVNDPGLMLILTGDPMKLSLGRKKHGLLVR
jgi:tyrosyl-tRNA synthetase